MAYQVVFMNEGDLSACYNVAFKETAETVAKDCNTKHNCESEGNYFVIDDTDVRFDFEFING